jgi:PTS system maltose and glucose-specific IIC component
LKPNKDDEYNLEFINNIINGVGGEKNIKIMANCVTRLRVTVFDKSKVDQELLQKTNPYGIKEIGDQYQIIYGPRVVNIATKVRQTLGIEE